MSGQFEKLSHNLYPQINLLKTTIQWVWVGAI